jgi:phosphoribosylformylglycinamidine cyclo-ligase
MTSQTDSSRYAERGVSSGKEAVHKATAGLNKGLYPGAFCTIFPDRRGDRAYGNILHCDGAGTKASLAYLAYREKFGMKVWPGIAQDSAVMNFDDVACVGALGPMDVSQIISRNPFLVPDDVVAAIVAGCKAFCDKMNGLGFKLRYVSGETQDTADLTRTVAVDNAVAVDIRLADVIDASRMVPGDIIVGFSSTGQAPWEDGPNSGIGSNGLTNARHETLSGAYAKVTESYSPEMRKELVYCGPYRLTDPLPGDLRFTIGSALLSPTRTYLPLIKKLIDTVGREGIHGLIHCSGGGQTKIGKFGGPENQYVKDHLFPVPPLFQMLQKVRRLSWSEMYQAYNMGHRLEAVVSPEIALKCIKTASAVGIGAKVVGRVAKRLSLEAPRVIVSTEEGTFEY